MRLAKVNATAPTNPLVEQTTAVDGIRLNPQSRCTPGLP